MWFWKNKYIDHLIKNDQIILHTLSIVITSVKELKGEIRKMSQELDALKAQVAASIAVETSAVTLINGLADKIKAAGTDTAALADIATELNKLTGDIKTSSDALSAVVTANTPTV